MQNELVQEVVETTPPEGRPGISISATDPNPEVESTRLDTAGVGVLRDVDGFGCSGWFEKLFKGILVSGLRRKILHDIVWVSSGNPECFRLLCRRASEARTRSEGFVAAVFHDAPNREHIHILHDCTWHSSTCRCSWLEAVKGHLKPRTGRQSIRVTGGLFSEEEQIREASRRYLRYLLEYFFRKGGCEGFLQVAGRNQRPSSFGLSCVPWFEIPLIAGQSEMEGRQCDGKTMDMSDSDSFDSSEVPEIITSSAGPSRAKRQKISLEDQILNMAHMFPCTPLSDLCNVKAWTEQKNLRGIRRNNEKYKDAMEIFALELIDKTILEMEEMYQEPGCCPVFSAPRGRIIDYYLTKEDTLKYVSDLLEFQCDEVDVTQFLQDVRDVCDRVRPKINTLEIFSPPSAGKTWFIDFVSGFFLSRGNQKNFNKFSSFPFEDCHNKRIIVWNEPNATPESIDTIKMLFGGDDLAAAKKYQGDVNITRTPVFVTTNAEFYPRNEALNHRRLKYKWKAAPFLKDITKKPNPLYFPDLLRKYNVSFH
jgi:hypothetical protein